MNLKSEKQLKNEGFRKVGSRHYVKEREHYVLCNCGCWTYTNKRIIDNVLKVTCYWCERSFELLIKPEKTETSSVVQKYATSLNTGIKVKTGTLK